MKKAFTMVELIFVIVIIGILGAVAVPKLMATRDDAYIVKNSQYIMSIMTEISTYIVAKGDTENNLSEMSSILDTLNKQGRVVLDIPNKSAGVKIGDEESCITVDIESNGTTEILGTSFVPTTDRICQQVQAFIKEKDYPLILRGRLIKY